MSHHVLVNEQLRLVFFTIPKVGCTQLIQLMRRAQGATDWLEDPHYKPGLPLLKNLGRERVNEILDDPTWMRAVVLRDPAERLLSAYLDKFIYRKGYAANVFGFPGHGMAFETFLSYVLDPNEDPRKPIGLHQGTDPHWRPQLYVGSLETVAEACNSVGDFLEVDAWIERVLRRVNGWDMYGATGWGADADLKIFERNSAPHPTHASKRMAEFYDRVTLEAVYEAYAGDIRLAANAGFDLVKHSDFLD